MKPEPKPVVVQCFLVSIISSAGVSRLFKFKRVNEPFGARDVVELESQIKEANGYEFVMVTQIYRLADEKVQDVDPNIIDVLYPGVFNRENESDD